MIVAAWTLTRALAVYGAALATTALVWQVIVWKAARKNRVTVEVAYGFLVYGPDLIDCVNITVINRHDHAVRVTSVGFDMQDDPKKQLVLTLKADGDEVPGGVASHDSGAAHPLLADLEQRGVDVKRPLVAWARLGTGELIRSKARTLMK